MRVLIAVDFSESSRRAIREVAERPWPAGSEVRLLSVVEPVELVLDEAPSLDFRTARLRAATEAIEAKASALRERVPRDTSVTTAVVAGYPRSDISAYAREYRADLVVVGSRGLGAVGRFLLGSVAKSVARNCPSSVEIVRSRDAGQLRRGMRLLLATDGSAQSRLAAQALAALPWPAGSELRIVCVAHAVHTPTPWTIHADEWNRLKNLSLASAESSVDELRRILTPTHLPTTTLVVDGEPKLRLLEECEAAGTDLLVLGSHGRKGLDRLLLGSVSEALAVHAPCSVEIVRGEPPAK